MKIRLVFIITALQMLFACISCENEPNNIESRGDVEFTEDSTESQKSGDYAPSLTELKGKLIRFDNWIFKLNTNGRWSVYKVFASISVGAIESQGYTPYPYYYTNHECSYSTMSYEKIYDNQAHLSFSGVEYPLYVIFENTYAGAWRYYGEIDLYFTEKNKGIVSVVGRKSGYSTDKTIKGVQDNWSVNFINSTAYPLYFYVE